MLAFSDGTKDIITTDDNFNSDNTNNYYKPKKTYPLAHFSAFFGVISLVGGFIAFLSSAGNAFWPVGLVCLSAGGFSALLAIIFALITLKKVKKFPDKYIGDDLAYTGMVFGYIILSISLLVISVLFLA